MRILITPGEPAGIGPDITLQIAQRSWSAELVVIANEELLLTRAQQLGLPLQLTPFNPNSAHTPHRPGHLKIASVPLQNPVHPGQLDKQNAPYVIQSLELASNYCQQKIAQAIVTGPVHKGIINEAKIPFSGHTEFFAKHCHVADVIMLFVTPKAKVALATTHLALADVPRALTQKKIITTLRLLHLELSNKFGLTNPKILVCGLNPHAGEQGHLGREEIDIIIPALNVLRAEHKQVIGPLPADTLFTDYQLQKGDAVLAMYHDQALPVVKYMSFGHAVNVTLGLPYLRTSVDHGVALDMAGTGKANADSLADAIHLAIDLVFKK